MTKEAVIISAYGAHWEIMKDYINDSGWCSRKVIGHGVTSGFTYEDAGFTIGDIDIKFGDSGCFDWRPKTLRGIEDNNGWTKVSSQDDLPQSPVGMYDIIWRDKEMSLNYCFFDNHNSLIYWDDVLYYKPSPIVSLPLW